MPYASEAVQLQHIRVNTIGTGNIVAWRPLILTDFGDGEPGRWLARVFCTGVPELKLYL
jgi:hypothetical protein